MINTNDDNRVFGLDLMRTTAICLVLIGHCGWIYPNDQDVLSQLFAFSAFMGVEVFFVLSGFLIGRILFKIYTTTEFTWSDIITFLKRRWFRTVPNYYLILIVNIIIGLAIGYQLDELWRYFFFLQNFSTAMLPFFTESWSLPVEEFAYILLPASLFIALSIRPKDDKKLLFLAVALALILIFIICKIINHMYDPSPTIYEWNLGVKSVVVFRVDSIIIGVLYAWLSLVFVGIWKRFKIILAVVGALGMCFFLIGVGYFRLFIDQYPIFWNIVYLPLTSLSIGLFLPLLSDWKSSWSIIKKPVTFISLISYSLYLIHYSVTLQTMKQIVPSDELKGTALVIFLLCYLAITFALSTILYKFYEKPVTDRRDN
ncbi:MAG TPA: acyltransferase [Flavobacterium sp.]